MPIAKFGEKTPLDSGNSKIFKLTSKDQSVTFRILGDGFYNGKHFLQKEDGNWTIFLCPRIMQEKSCMYCEKYFEVSKKLKELKEDEKGNKDEIKEAESQLRRYSPTIRWYYPALNRDTGEGMFLEVSLSVRNKLEEFVDADVDILGSDFTLKRTEKPGADYYSLIRKDSADTPELTADELSTAEEILQLDIENEVQGKESSLEFAPETEDNK